MPNDATDMWVLSDKCKYNPQKVSYNLNHREFNEPLTTQNIVIH